MGSIRGMEPLIDEHRLGEPPDAVPGFGTEKA